MSKNDYPSVIFPIIQPLPQVLGEPRLRRDVIDQIRGNPSAYSSFRMLTRPEQEAFLDFCVGNRGLKVTYDPFFQHIFNPDMHPDRLDRLLSSILEQKVKVRKALSRERRRLSENSALIIMDILVELADRRLAAVEMQRFGYDFPIERGFCYAADLMLRQYDQAKKKRGKKFSYRDIKPVYIIVLMENSPGMFHKVSGRYIHRSSFSFDTGLQMKAMENFIYISLDIFREMPHNNLTELDAWLYFLASDSPPDILRIVNKYPIFQELYQDIVDFRYHPEELIAMYSYSKALRIMDKNTVDYMIDELKKDSKKKQHQIQRLQKESQRHKEESQRHKEESQRNREESQRYKEENEKLLARLAQYELDK